MHVHTYIHTYAHTYAHTYVHTYIHTYIHTHVHSYTHTIHTCTYIPCICTGIVPDRHIDHLLSGIINWGRERGCHSDRPVAMDMERASGKENQEYPAPLTQH